jgi:hypothetical protein
MSWAIKLTIVGGVTLFFYAYFGTGFFSITTYTITGVDEETRITIEKQLHDQDTKKLYKIFPADKIFTYSGGNISKTVRTAVPELASITTRPVGLHTVKVEITLLKPLFRVSDTQALTDNGIIFTTKYDIHTFPRIVIASSTTKTIKNNGLVFTKMQIPDVENEKEFLIALSQMVSKISSVIFTVETVSVEEAGDVLCIDERGMSKVIFLKDSDYKKTWSTLVSSIDTDPLKTKLDTDKAQLEYLDARYGNKVFYRFSDMAFQNGSVNGILGNHATTTQEVPRTASTTTH